MRKFLKLISNNLNFFFIIANNINDYHQLRENEIMNTSEDLLDRLIKGFSVSSLKNVYNLEESKGRQYELIRYIIKNNSEQSIKDVFFDNFSLLKQHVYVYDGHGVFMDGWLDKHPSLYSTQKVSKSEIIYNFLFLTTFSFYNMSKGVPQNLEFYNPVQIIQKGNKLIIHINILERDLKSIVDDIITTANRDFNDLKILESIMEFLPQTIYLSPLDVNRGIKTLWDEDEIDALRVKFTNSKSISSDSMHERLLVKRDYPDKYKEIIEAPLSSTSFEVLIKDDLIRFFSTDPSRGTFNFVQFPTVRYGINELINLVLKNN